MLKVGRRFNYKGHAKNMPENCTAIVSTGTERILFVLDLDNGYDLQLS